MFPVYFSLEVRLVTSVTASTSDGHQAGVKMSTLKFIHLFNAFA